MIRTSRTISIYLALALVIAVQFPERAEARATVVDRELVSRTRVGRTSYLYTYRLTLNNDGPSLDNVNVWALCDAPGTTMVDEIAEFGDIDADTVVQSTGTFSFRQDRRTPFDPDCLIYEIGFLTPLIISGQAVDDELSNALIIGTVNHPASGRPIVDAGLEPVDTFTTTADANGNFTLEMEVVTQEDFVTIEAMGVGEQQGAALTNILGSVGALHDAGDDGSIIINPGNFGSDITHITTALAELAERANGGPIMSDGELAAAVAQVNGGELLIMAAVIKTFVDNPNVPLPPGINSIEEVISDPDVFQEYLTFLQQNFPAELNAAISETSENLRIGFTPEEVSGVLYAAFRDVQPETGDTFVFDFEAGGTGSVVLILGDSDINWNIGVDGEIVIDLLNPPVLETFRFANPPGQNAIFVRADISVDRIEIIRLDNGPVYDQLAILERTTTSFPDNPEIPPEVFDEQVGFFTVFLAFGPDGISPIAIEEVSGNQIAAHYFNQESNTSFGFGSEWGAEILQFNADGTGSTPRTNRGFNWNVDVDGTVVVTFDNGDANRYLRYSADGIISQTIVVGSLANGIVKTRGSEAIEYDGVSNFSEANLLNRRYRLLRRIIAQIGVFDFLFLPGGTGCNIVGSSARPLEWQSTPANTMDMFQFPVGSPPPADPARRRSWEAITVLPGVLGDRYWMIQNLENRFDDPNFEFPDPAVTPGRIVSYEFIEDLTGQVNPCGF